VLGLRSGPLWALHYQFVPSFPVLTMLNKPTSRRNAASSKEIQGGARPHYRPFIYLTTFVMGALGSLVLLWSFSTALASKNRLPAPPLSGTWCIDHRLAWLRQNRQWREAAILAVGSSATMRNLNFEGVPPEAKSRGIVNVAPCFLTVNQTRYFAEYILERSPAARSVVMVLAPRDLEGCSRNRTDFFETSVADRYMTRPGLDWLLYFRNLRFRDIATHAIFAPERQSELRYDAFGSGPLVREVSEIGRPFKPEAACYKQLTDLARSLAARRVEFIVATFPVMPGWAERFDERGEIISEFKQNVIGALRTTDAILVDGASDWKLPDAAFADAVHLQWPFTAGFTEFVWHAAGNKGAALRSSYAATPF
jgi:hypothetical protein